MRKFIFYLPTGLITIVSLYVSAQQTYVTLAGYILEVFPDSMTMFKVNSILTGN
jgi:hypothetical protein